jgi:hypothetical protein
MASRAAGDVECAQKSIDEEQSNVKFRGHHNNRHGRAILAD